MEVIFDRVSCRRMILATLTRYLDGTHQRSQSAYGHPVHAACQTKQHAGAECIATARRINDLIDAHDRDIEAAVCGEDFCALLSSRDYQRGDALRDFGQR